MTSEIHTCWRTLLEAATLAPSSHNTQPWQFCITETAIDLIADRTRALPVNDPDDRELTISCGAALFNLRVAVAHQGVTCDVQMLPSDDPDWLARVHLNGAEGHLRLDASLYASLAVRRTYRKRFTDRAVDVSTLGRLREAAVAEGARFVPIDGDQDRQAVATLVRRGTRCNGRIRAGAASSPRGCTPAVVATAWRCRHWRCPWRN
jgi:nitroreductase